jgi:hypothetical protein
MSKRTFQFEITNSAQLNKMLSGLLMDARRHEVDKDTIKSICNIVDKINRNNMNQLAYKELAKDKKEISFFAENDLVNEIK